MKTPPCPHAPRRAVSTVTALACLALASLLRAAESPDPDALRIATFNVSLYGEQPGQLLARLQGGDDPQARRLAAILQLVRPHVVLLNEIDADEACLEAFHREYLAIPQDTGVETHPGEPLSYPFRYQPRVNTGVHSGFDLNRDGRLDPHVGSSAYADDCWGYGRYPGQYGMAILSQFPVIADEIRSFAQLKWRDMPSAELPDDASTIEPHDWYSAEAMAKFPVSSKSHVDVPLQIGDRVLHVLASHPTPPAFDGAEQRNKLRNGAEIQLWIDYLSDPSTSARDYLIDDQGRRGGLAPNSHFVVLGDLNADPYDGDSSEAIGRLLAHPRVALPRVPRSLGAVQKSRRDGGANVRHRGDPSHDTLDASDRNGPGNLRVDYVLPSRGLQVVGEGVFWPESSAAHSSLVWGDPFPSSDHRLVWADVAWQGLSATAAEATTPR